MVPEMLYRDKSMLVCYKPAGMAVQTRRMTQMDLEYQVRNMLFREGKEPYLALINRLDQPVEGIVLFALDPEAAADLSRQLQSGQMKKEYLAASEGKGAETSGVLTDYLLKDPGTNLSRVAEKGTKGAKKAVLSYSLMETISSGCPEREQYLYRICLETGRHHQIRVQMANAGMPLLGDRKYNPGTDAPSLALCAARLSLLHPMTREEKVFSVCPEGLWFQGFLKKNENLWTLF